MAVTDSYKTIAQASEGTFKDKGSKFIAYAYPVFSEEKVKEHLKRLKKEHYNACHHCYAWRLGADMEHFRTNDDGEPSSTAGKPILGQLQSNELTNMVIIVVRYFGGTLLGVSGLINAYRSAAAEAIANAKIITKIVEDVYSIEFNYLNMNNVMKLIKEEKLEQMETSFDLNCRIKIPIRQSEVERIIGKFSKITGVKATFDSMR